MNEKRVKLRQLLGKKNLRNTSFMINIGLWTNLF